MNDETQEAYAVASGLTRAAVSKMTEATELLRQATLQLDRTGHRGADVSTEHAIEELGMVIDHCQNDAGALRALAQGGRCWCGNEAEVWNPASEATGAHAACFSHAKDGYMAL